MEQFLKSVLKSCKESWRVRGWLRRKIAARIYAYVRIFDYVRIFSRYCRSKISKSKGKWWIYMDNFRLFTYDRWKFTSVLIKSVTEVTWDYVVFKFQSTMLHWYFYSSSSASLLVLFPHELIENSPSRTW